MPKLRKARLEQFTKCIQKWKKHGGNDLVVVLGTGSYGHPVAKKFKLEQGLPRSSSGFKRWEGVVETRLSVMRLLTDVSRIFMENEIPVFSVSPAAIYANGKLTVTALEKAISNGLVPVLHGDMVFDSTDGALIYSGDNITVDVAKALKADEIQFVTQGDGIFFDDKKVDMITARELADVLVKKSKEKAHSKYADVSSGFFGKLGACLEYIPKNGTRIYDGEKLNNFKRGFTENEGGSLIVRTFN